MANSIMSMTTAVARLFDEQLCSPPELSLWEFTKVENSGWLARKDYCEKGKVDEYWERVLGETLSEGFEGANANVQQRTIDIGAIAIGSTVKRSSGRLTLGGDSVP